MAKRTGAPTLLKLAERMCQFVGLYGNTIKSAYPSNTALHTAVDAANLACATLALELETAIPKGD